jgi:hypothetical protein
VHSSFPPPLFLMLLGSSECIFTVTLCVFFPEEL